LLSDEELIDRLAGDDPERIAAARTLLGVSEGFPEAGDAEFDEIARPNGAHIVHTSEEE